MGFVEIFKRKGAAATSEKADIVVSFSPRGSSRTVCAVVMRPKFLERSGFGLGNYRASIDAERSAIKIWPAADGTFKARHLKSALVLDLGFIEEFSGRNHKKLPPSDVALGDGFVVIALPAVERVEAGEESPSANPAADVPATGEGKAALVAPKTPPAAAEDAAPRGAIAPGDIVVEHNGVRICLARDRGWVGLVGFTHKPVDVSPRGAKLVAMLARVMPACIGDPHLVKHLWSGTPPGGASVALDMVIADLKSLAALGLEVRTQRGVGRQLLRKGEA